MRGSRHVIPMLLLVCLAGAPTAGEWGGSSDWCPDCLFYEGMKREVQGEGGRLDSAAFVYASPKADSLKRGEADEPPRLRRYEDPEWVSYTTRLYHRRWSVPVMAAAVDPLSGANSLETISLLGYVALGPLLYLLLSMRFGRAVSTVVAAACLLLPPVLEFAKFPATDSWGLTLLVAGFLTAMLVLERGLRWLPAWITAVLLLSFTRDTTIVLVIATAWLALRSRDRTSALLAGSGFLAALPAPLLFGSPIRDYLAYTLNDFRVPTDTSWGFIAREYPSAVVDVVHDNLTYPTSRAIPPLVFLAGVAVLAGLVLLFLSEREDPFFRLQRAAAVGAVVPPLLAAASSGLRIELVFVPSVAVGLALLAERIARWWAARRGAPARAAPETS